MVLIGTSVRLGASGYYGPTVYLNNGGQLIDATPQFYWKREVKRFSREFQPTEKRVPVPEEPADSTQETATPDRDREVRYARFTAAQDLADFEAALTEGRVAAPDRSQALKLHAAARRALDSGDAAPAEEMNSEFADYHRGARAFRHREMADARAAWQALLARPAQERHYRSAWAAFMLGKLSLREGNPEAVTWFQRTRELAHEGFADPLGLAADSYGWEAASEESQGHLHRAAELFLTQLALGDESAVDSLKQLIPKTAADDWRGAAADPLLRKLTTTHLLAFGGTSEPADAASEKSRRWVAMLQELKIGNADGAEYFAWIAYRVGDYTLAQSWLEHASDVPAALWLRAKLLRREGHLAESAQVMLQAWKGIQKEESTHSAEPETDTTYFSFFHSDEGELSFEQNAGGDYGALRLSRGEFVPALDAFRTAGFWIDAAYIAEQILTTAELKRYVDRQPPEPDPAAEPGRFRSIRHLLGRRLMREERYAEAFKYLPKPYDQIARRYVTALGDASNPRLSKTARARAWFRAGWVARYSGMELMGTEGPPDNFATRGDFPADELGRERIAGVYEKFHYGQNGFTSETKPAVLKPTRDETERLKITHVEPNTRFHYRIIAVRLMMKAAPLLPTNSPVLADVINRAGWIIKEMEPDLANQYFRQLERRCAQTELGKAALAKGWFVREPGPWSLEESAALEALLAQKPSLKE